MVVVVIVNQSLEEDGWTMLRLENEELLRRMTELQQQSWMLEEKVSDVVFVMHISIVAVRLARLVVRWVTVRIS